MIFSTVLRTGTRAGLRRATPSIRQATSGAGIPPGTLSSWYNLFGKSNAAYLTWIVAGVLVAEGVTGFATDAVWNSANKGRTYESVDWSKFIVDDDGEEEEEEEDEDDDDDE